MMICDRGFESDLLGFRKVKNEISKIFNNIEELTNNCKMIFTGKNYRFIKVGNDFILVSPNKKLITNIDNGKTDINTYFEKELVNLLDIYGIDVDEEDIPLIFNIAIIKGKITISI